MRRKSSNGEVGDGDNLEDVPLVLKMGKSPNSSNISCEELLDMQPAKCGYCSKKNNSIWSYFFPFCFPPWKTRYLVLLGNFLYRFSSENGSSCKGIPIPIDSASFTVTSGGQFEVSTIRKVYFIKCIDDNEAQEWVAALKARKLLATKESMGHAPVSADTKRANQSAMNMFQKRLQLERDTADKSYAFDPTQG